MKNDLLLLLFPLFLINPVIGQKNLIPNPSFEVYKKTPNTWCITAEDFDKTTISWSSPTNATPDIYTKDIAINWWYRKNGWGVDSVIKGNRMLGLILYHSSIKSLNYREYAQCKLKSALKKDSLYKLTFKVKLSEASNIATNNTGIYLSNSFFQNRNTCDPLPLKPQFNTEDIVSKDKTWKELIYQFKATDNFEYLTIGNFFNNKETKFDSVQSQFKSQSMAYYFFDDFNLSLLTKDTVKKEVKKDFKEVFNLSNIYFEFDKADINKQSVTEIDKIADYLLKNQGENLVIHGFADKKGKESYNLRLSELRACNIKTYLIERGIADSRLQCIGHGEQDNSAKEDAQRKVAFELK